MSKLSIDTKIKQVNDFVEKIKKAKSFLIFEYLGLNVKDIVTMRRKMHDNNAIVSIIKNNILNRALKQANVQNVPQMVGPNAIILCNDNEIIGFKTLFSIMKNKPFVKYKFGYLENKIISQEQLKDIASIPDKKGLYSMLLSCLQAPLKNFLYGLKAISKNKGV